MRFACELEENWAAFVAADAFQRDADVPDAGAISSLNSRSSLKCSSGRLFDFHSFC